MAKRKLKFKRNFKRFIVTLLVLIGLVLLRTFVVLPDKITWMYDVFSWAMAFLFVPLLQYLLNDIFNLNILKR